MCVCNIDCNVIVIIITMEFSKVDVDHRHIPVWASHGKVLLNVLRSQLTY